jgi:hypothetical protein
MRYDSSEYSIEPLDDGRIDIANHTIREHLREGVTLYPSEIEVFIKRLRDVAHEIRETRPLD